MTLKTAPERIKMDRNIVEILSPIFLSEDFEKRFSTTINKTKPKKLKNSTLVYS